MQEQNLEQPLMVAVADTSAIDAFLGGLPPRLRTENPFVQAQTDGKPEAHDLLVAAARLNEARLREALELIALARRSCAEGSVALAEHQLRDAAFALGALLPPVNIRISTRLTDEFVKSLSGRKAA